MEARINNEKNILVCSDDVDLTKVCKEELDFIRNNFCGVVSSFPCLSHTPDFIRYSEIYLCGDISVFQRLSRPHYVIKEISYNHTSREGVHFINAGEVPILVHGVGVLYRQYFNSSQDLFKVLKNEHEFQSLTESTKPNLALRKGIYLSDVVTDDNGDLKFHLLRCSSNLSGPTENFSSSDKFVVGSVNSLSKNVFDQPAELNHVLVQIYENVQTHWLMVWIYAILNYFWLWLFKRHFYKATERKAAIKAHSDKTKDMPRNGLIAFCSFYKSFEDDQFSERRLKEVKRSKLDKYNWCYKNASVLTRLHFKLKSMVDEPELAKEFTVTLYPNSVFIIPLSTNRLYTHEIRPSTLGIDKLPIRMGYVIRCSNTEAVYTRSTTHILENDGSLTPLRQMTSEEEKELRDKYYEENTTDKVVEYGRLDFSMNSGDYKRPIE